jgi:LPS export ABC transporter protein LptC
MKRLRLTILVVVLVLVAGAIWWSGAGRSRPGEDTAATQDTVAYDYEARDVVLRQMGPDGQLQFQIEAKEIRQLPDSGRMTATGLTMTHDPPGTAPGGPNRWTMTADSGELPSDGGVVTLTGNVRANGRPAEGNQQEMRFAADHLSYNLDTQDVTSDDMVNWEWGRSKGRGRGLKANIRTGDVHLASDVRLELDVNAIRSP